MPTNCREQASSELLCNAHGPVDSRAQPGYEKVALLVIAVVVGLIDIVDG